MWTEHEFWLKGKENSDESWTRILAEQQRQFKYELNMNSSLTETTIQMWIEYEF